MGPAGHLLLLLLVVLLVVVDSETSSVRTTNYMMIGENITEGQVSLQYSQTIALDLLNNTDKAIRLTVSSSVANLSLPLFISIRQGRHLSSLTLPYIEAGRSYSQVSKTLCPLLNQPLHSLSSHMIYIDISSPSHFNISFNLSTTIVTDYNLRLNSPLTTTVSVSSPIVHVFEYPDNIDRVLIKVTSLSLVCGLVSVQTDLCPVDQLLDSTDHRGMYQSIQKLGALNIKRPTHQNFVYIVITLYHHGNCSDTNYDFIDGLVTLNRSANYDPVRIHDDDLLSKTVTIEIGHTLTTSQYAVGIVVPLLLLLLLLFGGCTYIIVDELCCYGRHSSNVFLLGFKENEPIEETDYSDGGILRKVWLNCLCVCSFLIGRRLLHDIKEQPTSTGRRIVPGNERPLENERERDMIPDVRVVNNGVREEDNNEEIEETDDGGEMNQVMNQEIVEEEIADNGYQENVQETSLLQRHNSYRLAVTQGTHSHTSQETHSHTTLLQVSQPIILQSTPYPRYITDLKFPEGKEFQKKHRGYWAYLLVLVIFYSLPVYQLVLTYQRYLMVSGNGDFCYYNSLCSHPLLGVSAFNNIWSNIGFLVNGVLFIIIAIRRRHKYMFHEFINEHYDKEGRSQEKLGVPQSFGIYYAAGIALIGESIMSAAYHVCPTGSNYQFDTAMMFVLAILGLYQLFKCRNPDINPSPHKLLLILALLILFIGLGVIYTGLIFYIIFFCIFEAGVIYTSLQIYYRWRLKVSHILPRLKIILSYICKVISQIIPATSSRLHQWEMVAQIPTRTSKGTLALCYFEIWPPRNMVQFIYLLLSNVINMLCSIVLVATQPADFATSFLFVMIVNFMFSLIFLLAVKIPVYHCYNCGRRNALVKSITYLVISIGFWIVGIICYQMEVTNWLESPAGSRNGNRECLILGFYDSHDLWHFCSSFGIFFAFLLLMTLEDHVDLKERSEIRIY